MSISPGGEGRWAGPLVILVGGAALFLAALDFSINVTLPRFREDLGESLVSVQWIIIVYHGSRSGAGIVAGGIADRYGLKRLLLAGVILYTAAVGLISLQSSLDPIVWLRVPQGIGVAILFTLGPALVARAFGPARRGAALGVTLSAIGAGTFAGTLGGGLLGERIGWEAIFWARVPIGIGILVLGAVSLRRDHVGSDSLKRHAPFDWAGAAVLFAALFVFVLAVGYARQDGWGSLRPIALYVTSAALAGLFAWRQKIAPEPLFPRELLRIREFSAGALSNVLLTMGTFVMWFLFPFFVADVLGRGALVLGALLAAMAAAAFIGSAAAGWLADRIGDRLTTVGGALIAALALLLLGRLDAGTAPVTVGLFAALNGLGFGVHQAAVYSMAMRKTPTGQAGAASAAMGVAQTLGTVASIAVLTTVLKWRQGVDQLPAGSVDRFLDAYSDTYVVAALFAIAGGLVAISLRGIRWPVRLRRENT